jgi:threonine/homoserine/homoserine lactone efflux protein
MWISNLALAFGVLADSVEVLVSFVMMIGGIYLTHLVQKWADRTGEQQPSAANVGKGGGFETHQQRTIRR